MQLSRAPRIRRTAHTRVAEAALRSEREVALHCLAQPGMAVLCVSPHRAYTKNVILAEIFLIIINHVI